MTKSTVDPDTVPPGVPDDATTRDATGPELHLGIGRHWGPEDYGPRISGGGAAKLAASAVGPLVAVARAVETLHYLNPKASAAHCRRLGIDKRKAQGRRFSDELQAGDILVMPWYLADQVVRAQRSGAAPGPASLQYRPAVPAKAPDGRELKYEFVCGDDTILGAHPGTPGSWFADADVPLMVAEGQLKADSALTGILIGGGVGPDDLRLTDAERRLDPDDLVLAAQVRLASLLAALPEQRRVCVIAIAGVYNFRKNPEWSMVTLADREVWVAVDGDVASNWRVWEAARQIFELLARRRSRSALLAPTVATPGGAGKIGVDDFLADWGSWDQLRDQLTPGLPDQPTRELFDQIGQYRISDDGAALEVCAERRDEVTDERVGGVWVEVLPIGGRVLAQTVKRKPTPEETRTGRFGQGLGRPAQLEGERVEIEVRWKNPAGDLVTEVVDGPSDILVDTPDRWHTHRPITIPAALKLHPKWPPRGQAGPEWLSAVKAHRETEIQHRTFWTRMGWVPVPDDVPVFLVGDQVIGERVEGTTLSEVGELLGNASLFGVGEDSGADWGDPAYRDSVAADLTATIDAVMAAFNDRCAAAVVLAAGVRAVLPIRSPAVVYLVGPPGSGKSYTAGVICAFWARKPGNWDAGAMPGSAKDSVAATEASLSVACMWVIDDLAPSSDARRQTREQGDMEDIIRMVHNGSSRGRMTRDGTPRPSRIPNSMLVTTAENDSSVESIRQRSLSLWFRHGSLSPAHEPTDALRRLCEVDGAPARVTQGLIKMIRHRAQHHFNGSWAQVVDEVADAFKLTRGFMDRKMTRAGLGDMGNTRATDIGGDLLLALGYLGRMASALGLDPAYERLLTGDDGLPADLARVVAENWFEHAQATPGRRLLTAISLALRSGRAHVTAAANPLAAPGGGDDLVAAALGWQLRGDKLAPQGPSIGVYGTVQKSGEEIVLLDYNNAFDTAARLYPDLLPPGTRHAATWQSARDDGLLAEPGPELGRAVTARHRLSGSAHRFSGVVVKLSLLLAPDGDPSGPDGVGAACDRH